ncbi:DUF2577 domain-containing protein [Rummeliibacillus sp. POC4]|nr:DUF2577 domain-containing protein [Rummeliibacillus sp. POC4]
MIHFVNDLARAIKGTSKKETNAAIQFPVFGTLDSKLDLLLDGFSRTIPKDDYHVWEQAESSLIPGSRVLCIPIEDGHTYVVMGKVK